MRRAKYHIKSFIVYSYNDLTKIIAQPHLDTMGLFLICIVNPTIRFFVNFINVYFQTTIKEKPCTAQFKFPQYIFLHIQNMTYLKKKKIYIALIFIISLQSGEKGTNKVSRKYKYNIIFSLINHILIRQYGTKLKHTSYFPLCLGKPDFQNFV